MDKDNFNANVDFVRGQADMIVLSALSDSDKYGLEILSAIQERSQGMYSLKQATLYSSLKRLEKNGYVHSYDGDISNGILEDAEWIKTISMQTLTLFADKPI